MLFEDHGCAQGLLPMGCRVRELPIGGVKSPTPLTSAPPCKNIVVVDDGSNYKMKTINNIRNSNL